MLRVVRRVVPAWLAVMTLIPCAASATPDPPPTAAPLALTISGGGTKGAYMAGHLYYTDQVGRLADVPLDAKVFTGASAGAINAVLATITTCLGSAPDPTQSLYWQTWTGIGLAEAFVPEESQATGLMTTSAYAPAIARLRTLWEGGLPASCDVLIGVAVTRARPRLVKLTADFPPLPRSRETALIRITGRGPGRLPRVRNVEDASRLGAEIALPLDGPTARPFDTLIQLVLASAAFPVVFAPVELPHCLRAPGESPRCTPEEAQSGLFMDGGIFDNQPLGVAMRAMSHVARAPDGSLTVHQRSTGATLDGARYYFLDPRARTTPRPPDGDGEAAPDDVIGIAGLLLGMVESSMASALLSVFERSEALREQLVVGHTYLPPISGTFTGFLERAFREFDFYLGMYNAARTIRDHPLGAGVPDVAAVRGADPALHAAWRPLLCLRAVLDGVGDVASCAGEDLADLRVILQVTLDQLADDCRRAAALSETPITTPHRQCAEAVAGGPPTQVPGVRPIAEVLRARRPSEGTLSYQLRLLGEYGFHFRDLGLTPSQSRQAPRELIRVAHRLVERFAEVQPRGSLAYGVVGQIGVALGLGYLPPQHSLHAILGLGGEVGYSGASTDPDWDWLRPAVTLEFGGLSTLFGPTEDYFALTPKAGLEVELYGSAAVQVRLGLRAGYQLSTADGFATGTCRLDEESRKPCSRFSTDLYASASVLGLLRLQLGFEYQPGLRDGQGDIFRVRPRLGFQFNSPF